MEAQEVQMFDTGSDRPTFTLTELPEPCSDPLVSVQNANCENLDQKIEQLKTEVTELETRVGILETEPRPTDTQVMRVGDTVKIKSSPVLIHNGLYEFM